MLNYRVSHLVVDLVWVGLGWVDYDFGVPPSCPAVQLLLPRQTVEHKKIKSTRSSSRWDTLYIEFNMTAVGMCGSLDFHFAFTTTADLELPAVPRGVPGLVTPGAEAEPVLGAVVAADVAGARLLGRGAPVPARRSHLHVVLAAVEVHAVSPAPEKGSCCCSIRQYYSSTTVQSGASYLSQGFEENVFGSSTS